MSQSKKRAAPRQRATLSQNIPMKLAGLDMTDTAASAPRQEDIDIVAWLAARANVATSTARVHAELFGIGGAQ